MTVRVVAPEELHLPETIRASVRRVDADPSPPKTVLLSPVSPTTLDLGPGVWEIDADIADAWSEPVYSADGQDVTLTLWPRGAIAGAMRGELSPAEQLIVHFEPAGGDGAGPSGRTLCTTARDRWSCALPAGEHDLRFTRSGYATEFRWGVKLGAGAALQLGTIQFTPGSSVSGHVQVASREARRLLKHVEVSLSPAGSNEHWGQKSRRYTAKADSRGFFQIRGVAPGEYGLYAGSRELVSDTIPVHIVAGTNAELKDAVVLGPPLRVSVKLDPPLDPSQRPWYVRLLRKFGDTLDAVAISNASNDGAWSAERLPPDDYLLVVGQQDGADWKTEKVALRIGNADLPIHLLLDSARVRGRVMLGERPIAAKVFFPDENGIVLVAGEDGRFEGAVPPQREDRFKLLVTSEVPAVSRSLVVKSERSPTGELTLDIELPSSVLAGRTINEDGAPEKYAIVTIQSEDGTTFEQLSSASDGAFQFEGFEPGVYFVQAESQRTRSAYTRVEIGTESLGSIDLVLRREALIRGRISMRGVPVAGAKVYAYPRDVQTSFVPQATSDATGRFALYVPADATTLDLIAFPRGFYITAARLPRDEKKLLVVEVDQDGGSLTATVPKDYAAMLRYEGAELSLAWIAHEGGTIEEMNGHYRITIPHLESGRYAICHGAKCVPVFVPPLGKASASLVE